MKNLQKLQALFLVVLFAGSLTFFSGCGKDDDDDKSNKEILTSHIWQGKTVESISTLDQDMQDYLDMIALFTPAIKVTFKKDGTYSAQVGTDDSDNGTWEMSSDEKTIIFDKGTEDEYKYEIISINDKEVSFKTSEEVEEGVIIEYKIIFEAD